MYQRRHVLDILIGFFSSPMADRGSRKLILEIIYKCTLIPDVALIMTTKTGVFAFLKSCATQFTHDKNPEILAAIPFIANQLFQMIKSSNPKWIGFTLFSDFKRELVELVLLLAKSASVTDPHYLGMVLELAQQVIQSLDASSSIAAFEFEPILALLQSEIKFAKFNQESVSTMMNLFTTEKNNSMTRSTLEKDFLAILVHPCIQWNGESGLFEWCMQHIPQYDLLNGLRWLLNLQMKKQLLAYSKVKALASMHLSGHDEIAQLCRAILINLVMDEPQTKRVRLQLDVTPCPRYLLHSTYQAVHDTIPSKSLDAQLVSLL